MSKQDLYHVRDSDLYGNKKDLGYLRKESDKTYWRVINRNKQGFNDNSYYEVYPVENGKVVETEELLSISSESVDFGFFVELTEEEFKLEVL